MTHTTCTRLFSYATPAHEILSEGFLVPSALAAGFDVTVYRSNVPDSADKHDATWLVNLREKARFMLAAVEATPAGELAVWADSDVLLATTALASVRGYMAGDADLFFQDGLREAYCTGFYAFRSSPGVRELFRLVAADPAAHGQRGTSGDQAALNAYATASGLSIGVFPCAEYASIGAMCARDRRALAALAAHGGQWPVHLALSKALQIFHAQFLMSVESKARVLRAVAGHIGRRCRHAGSCPFGAPASGG